MALHIRFILILTVSYLFVSVLAEAQPRDFGPPPTDRESLREQSREPGQVRPQQARGPTAFGAMQHGPDDQSDGRIMQLLKTLLELDLSGEQKRQIATLLRDQRNRTLRAKQQDAQTARTELQQISQADVLDEKSLDQAARKLGNAEKDLALARAQLYQKVRAVLSESQRAQLDQRREQMRKQMEQRANSVQELIDLWSSRDAGA